MSPLLLMLLLLALWAAGILSVAPGSGGPPLCDFITLAQAADELPRRRRGRKTNVSTLYRWTTTGCRGVKLQFIQCGATRCTTRAWLDEFFGRLSASRDTPPTVGALDGSTLPRMVRSAAERRRAIEAANRDLERAGI